MQKKQIYNVCVLYFFIATIGISKCDDIDLHVKKLQSAGNLLKKGIQVKAYVMHSGEKDEALKVLYEVSECSHVEVASSALNNIGYIHMSNGDLEPAREVCEKAVELNPQNALAHNNLGIIYEMRGDQEMNNFEKATEHFLHAHQHQHEKALSNLHRCVHKYGTVPSWHFAMINDEKRNLQFNNAIKRAIEKKKKTKSLESISVLDIGAGSGLLSMMAAREGVKNIFAAERVRCIALVAEQIIKQNGFEDSIDIIAADSKQLVVGEDFPNPADIVLAEILDAGLVGEGMLMAITDAFERKLAAKDAIVIPASGTIFAQIIDSPSLFQKQKLGIVNGFDLSAFNVFHAIYHNYDVMELHGLQNQFIQITDIQKVFDFSFSGVLSEFQREREVQFQVLQKGQFHNIAIVFWIDVSLDEESSINCSPYSDHRTCHWSQALQYLDIESLNVEGSTITVQAYHDEGRIWFSLE